MRKILFSLSLIILALSSCTNEMESLIENSETFVAEQGVSSRSIACTDSIVQLLPSDTLMTLKKIIESNRSRSRALSIYEEPDDYFYENIYAIRELPITIKARSVASGCNSAYSFFKCEGVGKEVTLGNSSSANSNLFYLKVLPASTGIPYLIYSKNSGTPLCVGHYTNNPNTKILMAAKDANASLYGAGWDLLAANSKGYFAIQSCDYLGQSDPDNWMSIFYHVLEASSNNKIRYAKRDSNKAQQEFQIVPTNTFNVKDVQFDLDNATITAASDLVVAKSYTNEKDYPDIKQANIRVSGNESSRFSETANRLMIKTANTGNKVFVCPQAVAMHAVFLESGNMLAPYDNNTNNFPKSFDYPLNVEAKASSLIQLTIRFKRFNLSVPYTMVADYNGREVKKRGIWYGTTIADPNRNAPTIEARFYDLETGEIVRNKLVFEVARNIYTVK